MTHRATLTITMTAALFVAPASFAGCASPERAGIEGTSDPLVAADWREAGRAEAHLEKTTQVELSGKLTNFADGSAIAGASVCTFDPANPADRECATSDASGSYTLGFAVCQDRPVELAADGFAPAFWELRIE